MCANVQNKQIPLSCVLTQTKLHPGVFTKTAVPALFFVLIRRCSCLAAGQCEEDLRFKQHVFKQRPVADDCESE